MPDRRKLGAEFIGTFAMVFVGCGAISVELSQPGVIGHFGISVIFGLVVGDDLRHRAYLRGAFQPGGHTRLCEHRALSVARPAYVHPVRRSAAAMRCSVLCPSMSAG